MNSYKEYGIYAIQNNITGHAYIGQTRVNFGDRRDCNFAKLRNNKHDNKLLQEDWNKYKEENYSFVVLEVVKDVGLLDDKERLWIRKYKNNNLSFNIADGGKGAPGVHLSEETKRIIGEKNRINGLGRKASDDTRKKMSDSHKGRPVPEYLREMRRQRMLGTKMSDEAKMKSSLSHSGENSHMAKYTKEQILRARELYDSGCKDYALISKDTGIVKSAIYAIVKRKRWKYV
jgi:group I intron endonuclease